MNNYEKMNVSGKKVYVFEDHAMAILPWREIHKDIGKQPYLITLDYHTDTLDAFLREAYALYGDDDINSKKYREEAYARVRREGPKSADWAQQLLRSDEHIDFAIKAGIISHSFSIQYANNWGTLSNEEERYNSEVEAAGGALIVHIANIIINQPEEQYFTYNVPKNRMFIVPHGCAIGCNKSPHDDDCLILHANQAIENCYLSDQIEKIKRMSVTSGLSKFSIFEQPFILDIDLDYFRTKNAINPKHTSIFYALIKNAAAITIAQEPECVEMLRLDNKLDSKYLLSSLLEHIKRAMCT